MAVSARSVSGELARSPIAACETVAIGASHSVRADNPCASSRWSSIGRFVRRFVDDYRLNWILVSPDRHDPAPLLPGVIVRPFEARDRAALLHDTDEHFGRILCYADSGAIGHVLEFFGEIASVAHYVDGTGYADTAIWPLRRNEMALVHVVTRPAFRRLGFASTLIAHATPATLTNRANAAISFVWWNHYASLRAFAHARWRTIGLSIELTRSGHKMRFHIPLILRRRSHR